MYMVTYTHSRDEVSSELSELWNATAEAEETNVQMSKELE